MNGYLLGLGLAILVFVGVLFQAAPVLNRGLFFGRTVDPAFPPSSEGRHLLGRYRLLQGLLALLVAVVYGLLCCGRSSPAPWLLPVAVLVYVCLASALWGWGFRRAGTHAVAAPLVRTASLARSDTPAVLHLAALLPLAGAGVKLAAEWQRIPARYPIHWNAGGVVDGWAARSPLGVSLPLVLSALLLLGLWVALRYSAPGNRRARWVFPVVGWSIALTGSWVALLPLRAAAASFPVGLLLIAPLTLLAVAVTLVFAFRAAGSSAEAAVLGDGTPDSRWIGGILYYNPADAALWVPKRLGIGWTLNLARPASWALLAGILALPLAALLLAVRAHR